MGLHQSDLLATAFVGNALGKEKAALGADIISPVMKTKQYLRKRKWEISERRGLADATALRSPVQLVQPSATTSI